MQTLALILTILAAGALCFALWRRNQQLTTQLQTAQQDLQHAQQEKIRFEERTRAQDQTQAEQQKFFTAIQAQAKDSFKQLAETSLKEQRAELVNQHKELYTPLKETLDKFTKQVGDLRTESSTQNVVLQNAIERTLTLNENLSKEAQNLTEALKSTKKQGTWGEIILEDVLTAAGLRKGIEFEREKSFSVEDSEEDKRRKRPDFIIHLPDQRDLIIDSKMSLTDYLAWQSATNEAEKQKHLQNHIASIEKHIKELSAQDYSALLPHEKLDFVFMFIPIEYAYFIAVQAKPSLNELARQNRIAIVTASNLFSVLQVADNLWRMERSSKTAEAILQIGQEMLERTALFAQRMEDIHVKIAQLDKAYNAADNALRGRKGIVGSAKKLEAQRLKAARQLPNLTEEDASALPTDNAD